MYNDYWVGQMFQILKNRLDDYVYFILVLKQVTKVGLKDTHH